MDNVEPIFLGVAGVCTQMIAQTEPHQKLGIIYLQPLLVTAAGAAQELTTAREPPSRDAQQGTGGGWTTHKEVKHLGRLR